MADGAVALASYAKQAEDDSPRKHAGRIQARAIQRCGKLLKQIESATGKHRRKSNGADTLLRKKAAEEAGPSKRQNDKVLRVATGSGSPFASDLV